MLIPISSRLRKLAFILDGVGQDSPYANMFHYKRRTPQTTPSEDIGMGPPSMYNDLDKSDKLKNKEDIRRQGERPETDWQDRHIRPVTVTNIGDARENLQGESEFIPDQNVNRDTFPLADDTLLGSPFGC